MMRPWGRTADLVSSSSPKAHLSLVVLFCVIRNPGFGGIVKELGRRFRLPQKLVWSIILGASVISVLYDLVVGGKDLDDISAYVRRWEKQDTVRYLFLYFNVASRRNYVSYIDLIGYLRSAGMNSLMISATLAIFYR
jgi:hypothetical protein